MSTPLQPLYERAPIALQNLAVALYGWRVRRTRVDGGLSERLEWLADHERRPIDEHRRYQEAQLGVIVERARNVPFYRRVMDERGLGTGDVRTLEDLAKLPVLRREQLRDAGDALRARDVPARQLFEGHTSGTTGSPLSFWWDRQVCVWNHTMSRRVHRWAGVGDDETIASLLGNLIVPLGQQQPPFWRNCRPLRRVLFSSFHLERRHLDAYLDHLRTLRGPWLEAYPSTAYVLARMLEERGETLPLRGVLLSSEPLLAAQRATIEERFETRAWDSYSMSERVVFAAECAEHDGQHLFPEFGIVEILDDDDRPVPPGEPGRLVATGLQNLAMPLIRYDTGDVTALDPEPCPCGRTLPRLRPITTKAEDVVVTPEGRFVSASTLTHPFKPLTSIALSQIVQERPEHVLVRIVPTAAYTDADGEALKRSLGERLGPSVTVDLERVETIPRTSRGKYRWVISRVPLTFGAGTVAGGPGNLFETDDKTMKHPAMNPPDATLAGALRLHLGQHFSAEAAARLASADVEWGPLDEIVTTGGSGVRIATDLSPRLDRPWKVPFGGSELTLWNRVPRPEGWEAWPSPETPIWWVRSDGAVLAAWDLHGNLARLLALEEERGLPRDEHGRVAAASSPRAELGLLEVPAVNEAVAALVAVVCGGEDRERWGSVEGLVRPPGLVLSHDLDLLRGDDPFTQGVRVLRTLRPLASGRGPDLAAARALVGNAFAPHEHYLDMIPRLVEMERAVGARSTFYFLTGPGGRYGARSGTAEIPRARAAIPPGWAVGLHYPYGALATDGALAREREQLEDLVGSPIATGRAHYLRIDPPASWATIAEAGIRVDESLGHADRIGYRAGIAGAFRPRAADGRELDLVVLPLAVMDGTLAAERPGRELETIDAMLAHLAVVGGTLTCLVHPERVDNPELGRASLDYAGLLSIAKRRGVRFLLPDDFRDG